MVTGAGIAWNGNLWVAVGDNNTTEGSIQTSPDGIMWSPITTAGFSINGIGVASTNIWASPPTDLQSAIQKIGNRLFYSERFI